MTVVIPVFNAARAIQNLLDILDSTVAQNQENLHFIILDDKSNDRAALEILAGHRFFERVNVLRLQNKKNLGFVRTVNFGFGLAPKNHDVLILNSDTLLRGPSIAVLQRVAQKAKRVASVTPLTNNGFVASLFNWPAGAVMGENNFEKMCDLIERLRILKPVPTPVGVGFCLYITARARSEVGMFDEKMFIRGYGEEEDWCFRASQKGFNHFITAETYVQHLGTQSFSPGEKSARVKSSQRKLRQRHPEYKAQMREYLTQDPLRSARARIMWRLMLPD